MIRYDFEEELYRYRQEVARLQKEVENGTISQDFLIRAFGSLLDALEELKAVQATIVTRNARLLEAERKQRALADTLREVAGVLNSTLDREAVLRAILEQLARVVAYDSASVMLVSGDTLELEAYRTVQFERRKDFTPLPISALKHVQEVFETRTPLIIPDTRTDPRWLNFGTTEHTHCWLGVPLVVQERVIGLLNLGKRQPRFYTSRDAEVAVAFAHHAAIAIENARLFEEVHAGRERLQFLSRRLLEMQENERRHIGRELHDEVGQLLTGLKLMLESIRRAPPNVIRVKLGTALEFVNEVMTQVRELSLQLRPTMLDDEGLLPALLWHIGRFSERTGVRVHFEHSGLDRRFPTGVETTAYRIVQEALTNVARHAGVQDATVRVTADEEMLHICVEDRGVGFDPEEALRAGGTLGLAGMRERVALLEGAFTLESAPGKGTRVIAALPIRETLRGEEGEFDAEDNDPVGG